MKTQSKVRLVIVGSADRQLEEMLRDSGAQITSASLDALLTLTQAATAGQPDAIIVDLRDQPMLPPALPALKRHQPGVGVVIVASTMDPALMLEGMRAGVNEWLAEPVTAATLTTAVQRVATQCAAKAAAGQVLAFIGAKGGVGTTTVAVNVATSLARVGTRRALLMDLHLAYGDAALFLGVEPRFTTGDAIENIHRMDAAFLSGVVSTTKAGVHLLASAERAVPPVAHADRVRELIEFAAGHYPYVVLDVPRSDMTMLDSLELASSIIVIANQELATVRRAGTLALTLRQRYGKDRVGVVINRFDRNAEIGREDVERVTGGSVRHVIPSDYRIALDGLNRGLPVVVENHNQLAGSFTSLARVLAGLESVSSAKPERPAGLFGRLGVSRS